MTPEELAALFHARRVGPGRWVALCPAHRDRSPSLSIGTGRGGLPLLQCHAGCDPVAVLATRGLFWRDLRAGPPRTPAERRMASAAAAAQNAEEELRDDAAWSAAIGYRRLWRVLSALGAKLACAPDGPEADALTRAFHRAARMGCEVESSLGCYGGAQRPPVKPCPPWSPFSEPEPEALEAGRVRTEAQMLCYVQTGFAEPPPEQQNEEARWNEPQKELE